jgi:hypothetical protein
MIYKLQIKNKLILLSISIIFLVQTVAMAGAWTQKKGKVYAKMDFRYLSGTKIYNSDGIKIPSPQFNDLTLGVFGSYGITDYFTTFINFAAFKTVKLDTLSTDIGFDTDVKGIGDIDIGMKLKLGQFGKTVISTKFIVGLPTGISNTDGGLWTGSGNFNQLFGLEAGHSFYPFPSYISAGVAFNNQTKGFSDEFRYIIEGGYRFSKEISLTVRLHGVVSFNNGDPDVKGGYGMFSNNQEYIAYNAELVYKFSSNFGVKGYYESGTNGKNIISAPVFNVGIYFTN